MKENTELAITENQVNQLAEKITPVKLMENSLAQFVTNAFQIAIEEDQYQQQIKAEIIKRLPDMKPSELIALITSASTNKNDLISKILSPTFSMLQAAQQNEMAARNEKNHTTYSQTNIREINAATKPDILQGLQTLMTLADKLSVSENKSTIENVNN